MAKKRLIPKILLQKGGYKNNQNVVVRTHKFSNPVQTGEVVSQAKIFQDQIADELIILRIDNEISKNELLDISNNIANEIFMPLTIGGGIDNLFFIEELLKNGAVKVSINSSAIKNPNIIKEASYNFGVSTVVASVDYKTNSSGESTVFSNNGKYDTKINLLEWIKKIENYGAGEILLCSIDNDGTRNGLDINTSKEVRNSVSIPVVISGGCGRGSHFVEGFLDTDVSGISAGTFFALQDQNFIQIRSHIINSGINIRN